MDPGKTPEYRHDPSRENSQREVRVKKEVFVLTLDPDGFKLTRKGRRKGIEIAWKDLVSGDAAVAFALNASLGRIS
jgi:hypothetical protein